MLKTLSFAICLLFLSVVQLGAQAPPSPPNVLLIVREEIKPGMMPAHSREANNVVHIWNKANSPHHRLAMTPVAGNENEVMYFWPFNSFADLEKSGKDLETISTVTFKDDFDKVRPPGDDYHISQRDSIAVLRKDLSYRPGADIAKMRFMRVQTVRVKPGNVREFEETRKIINAGHEKANIDEHMAVYQIIAGGLSNTYLIIIPWKSLDGAGTIPHGKEYADAVGEDNWKKMAKIENDSIVFSATDIYQFNPQLSFAPALAKADPAFWQLRSLTPTLAVSPAPTRRRATRRP